MEYYHKEAQSLGSILAKLVLRIANTRSVFHRQYEKGDYSGNDVPMPPAFFSNHFNVETRQVLGRNLFTIRKKSQTSGKVVLYFHGGGYVQNCSIHHWRFVRQFIKATGHTLVIPDYPLAPEHNYRETFEMAESVYKELIARVSPETIILMGDSAGGGLALALAQKMKMEQIPEPGRIILIAPWLDFSLSNPEIKAIEKQDALLDRAGLIRASREYAGDTDAGHYQLSPVNGPLEGLPPVSLFIGTHDILYPDVLKLKRLLLEKGVEVNYYEFPKMIHDWVVITFLKESAAAITLMKRIR